MNTLMEILRRSNPFLLFISTFSLVILLIVGTIFRVDVYNFFHSPEKISQDELLALTNADKYYVTVRGDSSFNSGYRYVEENRWGAVQKVLASYIVLKIDDQSLIVKTPGEVRGRIPKEFTGLLVSLSSAERGEVISRVIPGGLRNTIPWLLDTTDFRTPMLVPLLIAAGIGGISLYGFYRAIAQGIEMSGGPLIYSLSRIDNPEKARQEINEELGKVKRIGNVRVTTNWLVIGNGRTMNGVRLDDLVWIYKRNLGSHYEMVIWDRYERCVTVRGDQHTVNNMLMNVYENAPWIYAGFDANTEALWRTDRRSMIHEVDERRRESLPN